MKNLGYADALTHMLAGARVRRSGWNGKGMYVYAGAGKNNVPVNQLWNPHTRAFAEQNGGKADVLPYFLMRTADAKILMGWLASQSDMHAFDWEVLEDGDAY